MSLLAFQAPRRAKGPDRRLLDGPLVIGIDDTIERCWAAKIKACGIYRDPVRSRRDTSSKPAAYAGCR